MPSMIYFKVSAVGLLVILLASLFSFNSFAALDVATAADASTASLAGVQGPSGVLSGTGQITINGNAAQPGATILSGSTLVTGDEGSAVIEVAALGRVQLRANTTVTLTFSTEGIQFKSPCAVRITVSRGQVTVLSPKAETINADDDKSVGGGIECNATLGSEIILDCGSGAQAGATGGAAPGGGVFVGPKLAVLVLAGVGGTIAGVAAIRSSDAKPISNVMP